MAITKAVGVVMLGNFWAFVIYGVVGPFAWIPILVGWRW